MGRKERKEKTERRVDNMATALLEVVACQKVTLRSAVDAAIHTKEGAKEAHLWRRAGLMVQQEL